MRLQRLMHGSEARLADKPMRMPDKRAVWMQ
jgi:hypothetical protein